MAKTFLRMLTFMFFSDAPSAVLLLLSSYFDFILASALHILPLTECGICTASNCFCGQKCSATTNGPVKCQAADVRVCLGGCRVLAGAWRTALDHPTCRCAVFIPLSHVCGHDNILSQNNSKNCNIPSLSQPQLGETQRPQIKLLLHPFHAVHPWHHVIQYPTLP
jgi:hypothetical protein